MTATTAYLDASATVKLLRPEPETQALRDALSVIPNRVSSELLEVEVRCAARRHGAADLLTRAERLLAAIDFVPYTPAIRARAGGGFTPPQRALDALHLATALDLSLDGLVLFTYDEQQAAAAVAADIEVAAPK